MLTEKVVTNKMCLFCASDFHLEMILLPYIKEKIDEYKFVIFTKNDLEDTVNTLLEKVNINDEYKDKIRKINWKNENKLEYTRNLIENKQKLNIIVNGDYNYIENINGKLKEFVNYAVNHKWDYKNKNIYGETVMDIVEPAISNIDDIKTILYDGLESTKKSKSKAKESSDDELTFLNVNTGETGAIDTESLKILTSLFGLNNKKKK